jgi:hypothetical protein
MATGFQPLVISGKLNRSSEDGFELVKSLKQNVQQNLKMLILTSPGERVMSPRYGVGIKRFLFEMSSDAVFGDIDSKIREQASIYMPYLVIDRILFNADQLQPEKINLTVFYSVPRVSLSDVLVTEVL